MDHITLGRTGIEVSVMGLGAGGPSRIGKSAGKAEDESVAIVRRARELGVSFFDTAEGYGTEEYVGRGLRGVPEDEVCISTKLTCRTPRNLTWQSVDVKVQVGTVSATRTSGYEYVGANLTSSGSPQLARPYKITFNAPVDGRKFYAGAASFGKGRIPLSPHNPMPLSPDDLFFLTAENRIPTIFANIHGLLNTSGQATAVVTLPKVSSLVGMSFYMAFVTLDSSKPLGIRTVSSGKGFKIQS